MMAAAAAAARRTGGRKPRLIESQWVPIPLTCADEPWPRRLNNQPL
jgi:hypothetical protein